MKKTKIWLVLSIKKSMDGNLTWQSGTSPEAATTSLHEEYGGNGTDKKRTTANERHVVGLKIVETETLHEGTHEVSDGVDTGTVRA
jgi:hypothetical protein